MKNKLLMILLCGVIVFSLTGCGNNDGNKNNVKENSSSQSNEKQENENNPKLSEGQTLSCTTIDKSDNDTGRVSYTSVVNFKYDENYIIETITLKDEYKYDNKEATMKKKESEKDLAKSLEEIDYMSVEVGSNDISNVTVTTIYDIDKMDSRSLENFKYKNYINSKKFDTKKFQSDMIKEKNEKNLDITCRIK